MAPTAPVTLPLQNVLISMLHTLEFRIQNNSVGGKISGKTNKSGLPKVLKPRNYVSKK